MSSVIDKTLETIKREHIAPKSRGQVMLRRLAHWALGVIVIVIAALALAAGYELILDLDWDVAERRSIRQVVFLFGSLPYFWIAVTLALSVLAVFAVRKTEKGYRYSRVALLGGVVAAIVLSGVLFAFGHAGMRMHDSFRQGMPLYERFVETKEGRWSRPEDGFLGGTIVLVGEEGFELQGFRQERYFVIVTPETEIAPSVRVIAGEKVRVVGRQETQMRFMAELIRPFVRPGTGFPSGMGPGARHPEMPPMR